MHGRHRLNNLQVYTYMTRANAFCFATTRDCRTFYSKPLTYTLQIKALPEPTRDCQHTSLVDTVHRAVLKNASRGLLPMRSCLYLKLPLHIQVHGRGR